MKNEININLEKEKIAHQGQSNEGEKVLSDKDAAKVSGGVKVWPENKNLE